MITNYTRGKNVLLDMKQFLFLISVSLVVLACKKDQLKQIPGNFLCEVSESTSYTVSSSSSNYDKVLSLVENNDSIEFDGYKFPTSSFDPLIGSGSHQITLSNSSTVTLTLKDDFKTIEYDKNINSGLAGPSFGKTLTGTRTTIPLTTATTNNFADNSGTYELYIQEFENYNGLDESFFATTTVGYDPTTTSLIVNGTSRPLPLFHTHYDKSYSYGGGPFDQLLQEIYWDSDSLYFHYHHTSGQSYPPSDTTHYHYQGSRL